VPTASAAPVGIASGPDGNLWFTEYGANKIGRLTTTGRFKEFPIPTPYSSPSAITAGPDDNLWFTESYASKIGRVTITGKFKEFPMPPEAGEPEGITSGPDGSLWFAEFGCCGIGRMTTSGVAEDFPIPNTADSPRGIATGPDGNLWFTEFYGDRIGRLMPPPAATVLLLPSAPTPGSVSITMGSCVRWSFIAGGQHSVSDSSGMGLFGSGPRSPAGEYGFCFDWAGTYSYQDAFNAIPGTVKVPMTAKPKSGTVSTTFSITWANAPAPPDGFVFDVQIERPGSTTFASWMTGVTTVSSPFTPDAGAGTYRFRARLRNAGGASGYSAAASITVT